MHNQLTVKPYKDYILVDGPLDGYTMALSKPKTECMTIRGQRGYYEGKITDTNLTFKPV